MHEVVTVNHYMSPALTCMAVAAALFLDWFGAGADSWKDRVAGMLYLAGIREGWNGGALDRWTVERCSWFIEIAKDTGNAHIKDADTSQILGGLLAILMVYFLAAWLPNWKALTKIFGKYGRVFAPITTLSLPKTGGSRINVKMLLMVVPLALMADLIPGRSGQFVNWCLDMDCKLISFCLDWLL